MIDVLHGDCLVVLPTLAENSLDACVCDPPYHLTSIVKRFGKANSAPARDRDGLYARASRGFMGKEWDGGDIAFRVETWEEVFRVLKPGAHLVAFSATRTYHRMACAIEDAGFEIRDQLAWVYGSGFPKSYDVSKGIDRHNGDVRPVIGRETLSNDIRGGALLDIAHGDLRPAFERDITSAAPAASAAWEGWGTALKPAWEPVIFARKPLVGTVAANVLQHGTGAINIDGCRVGDDLMVNMPGSTAPRVAMGGGRAEDAEPTVAVGRWPANILHDGSDEVLSTFPDAPGQQMTVGPEHGEKASVNVYGDYGPRETFPPRSDGGSAARFFYSAKADREDRLGSKHPTVKPIDLMAYLCRLITPPGGTVLDPFAGSGTTGAACIREGFDAVLIEREADYIADINARLEAASVDGRHKASIKARNADKSKSQGADLPLFKDGAA